MDPVEPSIRRIQICIFSQSLRPIASTFEDRSTMDKACLETSNIMPQGQETIIKDSLHEIFKPTFYDIHTDRKSSSISELLKTETRLELDPSSINVFLRTGMYIGDKTPFLSIRASHSEVPILQPSTLDFHQAVDAYIDLFRQSMAKCLATHQAEPFTIGLSGGRDSRHILLEAVTSGAPPKLCWTICSPSTVNDTTVARILSERCGVRHEVIPATYGLEAELATFRQTNFGSLQHAWITGAHSCISKAPFFYDGIAGDVLSESSIVTKRKVELVEQGRLDEFAESIVSHAPVHLLRNIQLPDRSDAIEHVINELLRHLGAPNPVASFYFWNRTRRDIAESTFSILPTDGSVPRTPYLDEDLFSFLASLPPRLTLGTGLHSASIRRAYPEFADVPYASKSAASLRPSMSSCLKTIAYLICNRPTFLCRSRLALRLLAAILMPNQRSNAKWITTLTAYFYSIGKEINLQEERIL